MHPIPHVSRRSVLRALTVSAAMAGSIFIAAGTGSRATAAPAPAEETVDADAIQQQGHRHLIGVL